MIRYLKLFFKRISKDFAQKELLPLKLLFFIHASTIYVIYPYLTIHMRELGINVEETAIMSAITPVIAILMPPIAGMVADKIGNFKFLLAFFSAAGGATALLFLIVPVGRVTLSFPNQLVIGISCQPNAFLDVLLSNEFACTPQPVSVQEARLNLKTCGFVCQSDNDEKFSWRITDYAVDDNTSSNFPEVTYTVNRKPPKQKKTLQSAYQPLQIDLDWNHSVRSFGKNSYFFPAKETVNFSCALNNNPKDIFTYNTTSKSQIEFTDDFNVSCMFGNDVLPNATIYDNIQIGYSRITSTNNSYSVDYVKVDDVLHNSYCKQDYFKNMVVNVQVQNPNSSSEMMSDYEFKQCSPACIGLNPRKMFCSNSKVSVDLDTKVTFWSYLSVRVLIGIIGGTAFAMFEGAVIAILREHKADYGLQRIYATVGGMISSPLAGWLIDFASQGKEYTDFRPIFFLYASLKIISAVLMLFMNLQFKTPANNVLADVYSVLKDVELITLFIVSFVLGTAWGFIESFLFWLIQDLGGSKSLMGITITIGGIAGIPLLVLSGPIIKRIGHANVLLIGFIFYAIRLLGYSLIYNPWLCLIFEAMESITSSLSFTAAVTYAAKLSTVTTDTSVQGMLGGIYYGVGKGAGSLIGGYSIKIFGTRQTYRIFSVATAVTGLLYFFFNFFYINRRKKKQEQEKETEKKNDINMDNKDSSKDSIKNTHENIIKDDALPYEDALTNYGYEGEEEEEEEDEEERKGANVPQKKDDGEIKTTALPP
ncbi:uncharacterized protein LOC108740930 [Agrilus planipennis]|uniref:Uncharacterized protein LOC108740930 n=1 Tax=Agrilus planipennis TaxID=224129 RepID=A0A7F5QVH1_AGRPL|nr:uncharacterized protein LOC108740930 [Agrilus planipennis]